jgi:hypothetical protein
MRNNGTSNVWKTITHRTGQTSESGSAAVPEATRCHTEGGASRTAAAIVAAKKKNDRIDASNMRLSALRFFC